MPGTQGNKNRQIHGGASAVKAIARQEPFAGVAIQVEQEVKADLEEPGGLDEIIEHGAIRLETASRLYFDAFRVAIQDSDIDKATTYAKMFAWLQAAALRTWQNVRTNRVSRPIDAGKLIEGLVRGTNETDDQE